MNAASQVPTINEDDHARPGPGGLLRAARESVGVSLRDISAQLHLDERTVDSLEHDDFKNLPAPTFVRGYLRGYARLLSVPVGPVMEAYDREGFRPPDLVADISEEPESNATDFPISLVTWVVGLILVAMVIVWWNNNNPDFGDLLGPVAIEQSAESKASDISSADLDATDASQAVALESAQPGSATSSTAPQSEDVSVSVATPPTEQSPAPMPAPTVSSPAQPAADTAPEGETTALAATSRADEVLAQAREALTQSRQAAQSSLPAAGGQSPSEAQSVADITDRALKDSAPLVTSGAEQASPASDSTTGNSVAQSAESPQSSTANQAHLELTFAAEAWVEVYDRDNEKLFYDLAKAGEVADLRGATPLRVLLGRTRGVQVRFNEQPFDVTPFVEKGVARFTLP